MSSNFSSAPFVSGQIQGTSTNDSASAGKVGEYISSNVASPGSNLTTATPANLTSISLTAGDWDVTMYAQFLPTSTTSITELIAGISQTSATLDKAAGNRFQQVQQPAEIPAVATEITLEVARYRLSLAATTTIFAVIQATFTASTLTCYGHIAARRVR